MPIALRSPIVLVLSTVCLATPAWADFQAGTYAYKSGDFATALREWRPLAEQGDADAQYNLGLMYDKGYGVPQDYVQARQWYEKAASQGLADAQFGLGMLYRKGHGVAQDFVQAHMWFNLSGANGERAGVVQRDALAILMTPTQIDKAQKRAREWKPTAP
jgi:TPR repeat protein